MSDLITLPVIGTCTSFGMMNLNLLFRCTIDTHDFVQKATWSKALIRDEDPRFRKWSLPKIGSPLHEYYTPRLAQNNSSYCWRSLYPGQHIRVKLFWDTLPELTFNNFMNPKHSPMLPSSQKSAFICQSNMYQTQGVTGRLYVSNNLNWLKSRKFPIFRWVVVFVASFRALE